MQRMQIDFFSFKAEYIQQPDGFFPVYSCLKEDRDGNLLKVMRIDLICEWRLGDGKILFLEVPFEDERQFNEIIAYLKYAPKLLYQAILDRVNEITFPGD